MYGQGIDVQVLFSVSMLKFLLACMTSPKRLSPFTAYIRTSTRFLLYSENFTFYVVKIWRKENAPCVAGIAIFSLLIRRAQPPKLSEMLCSYKKSRSRVTSSVTLATSILERRRHRRNFDVDVTQPINCYLFTRCCGLPDASLQ